MFQKLFEKLKSISYDWLPLSGIVIVTYMIQRGFLAISKAGMVPDMDIKGAMSIFFTAAAFSALGIGFLSDRIKVHWLIILAGITGTIGILSLGYSPVIFGIGMGIAASVAKMIPFLTPLKNKDTKIEALRISPQAASKQIGAGLFFFLFAALIKISGFSLFTSIIAPIFAVFCFLSYLSIRKHNIPLIKWDLVVVKRLLCNWKWYLYALWYGFTGVILYTAYPKVIPGLMQLGNSKLAAITLFGILGLAFLPFRWIWAYAGDLLQKHWILMFVSMAIYIPCIWLIPMYPLYAIPVFLITMKMVTPNMWATSKTWFTKEDIGTAMGMVMIVGYLIIGWSLGKW